MGQLNLVLKGDASHAEGFLMKKDILGQIGIHFHVLDVDLLIEIKKEIVPHVAN